MQAKNNMPKHECLIGGLWRHNHRFRMTTLTDLKKVIATDNETIEWAKRSPDYHFMKDTLPAGYALSDYSNPRMLTGLIHFKFCPECGTRIKWEEIGRSE